MYNFFSLIALSSAIRISAVQYPLQEASNSQALISDVNKPEIDTGTLQGHLTAKNLLKRAKKLFEIAELGAEEYNHPTRVIGSAGRVSRMGNEQGNLFANL